jgi:hypothetical protein
MTRIKDIPAGTRFGDFTVLSLSHFSANGGHAMWNCLCVCGNNAVLKGVNLRLGRTKHCRHLKGSNEIHANNFKDLTGLRIGIRVAQGLHSVSIRGGRKGSALWRVLCDCGKESITTATQFKYSVSCGCDNSGRVQSGLARRSPLSKKERRAIWRRKDLYGLSQDNFEMLKRRQNNCCGICGNVFVVSPDIDHDHSCCPGSKSCGACIRGLLCHHCNTALGNFRDDPALLRKGVEYLEAFKNEFKRVSENNQGDFE